MEVDAETGEVIRKWAASERKKSGEDQMASALEKLRIDKERRANLFDKTRDSLQQQKKQSEERFKSGVDKIKKEGLGEKPKSPFDLD